MKVWMWMWTKTMKSKRVRVSMRRADGVRGHGGEGYYIRKQKRRKKCIV
jgi:hypothetical protein